MITSFKVQVVRNMNMSRLAKNRNHRNAIISRNVFKSEFVRGMHLNALTIFIVNYFLLPAMSKL